MQEDINVGYCNFEILYGLIDYIHKNCVLTQEGYTATLPYALIEERFHVNPLIFKHHCFLLKTDGCLDYIEEDYAQQIKFYNLRLRLEDRFQFVSKLLNK